MSWLSDRLARNEHRPYPVAALVRFAGIPSTDRDFVSRLALVLHLNRRTVGRYRQLGLTDVQADRWAARLGLHPMEVWPGIWGESIDINEGDQP